MKKLITTLLVTGLVITGITVPVMAEGEDEGGGKVSSETVSIVAQNATDSTIIEAISAPDYTITIPKSITFDKLKKNSEAPVRTANFKVKANNVYLSSEKPHLNIAVKGTDKTGAAIPGDAFQLKNGNDKVTLDYTVNRGITDPNPVTPNGTIATFGQNDTEQEQDAQVVVNQPTNAGDYKGTMTFTVSLDDTAK